MARIARYHLLAVSNRGLSRATVAASGRLMHFVILWVKWGFWAISLVLDMPEGLAMSLSTQEIIYIPTKVSAKILAHGIGVQGPSKLVKKSKTPHFASRSQANPSPK